MKNYKLLKDYVFEYLSDRIYDGSLKPGKKIDISHICQHLNISMTPVREALSELAHEGYLERLPRRGFLVKEVSLEKAKQIHEIIGCLEGFAAAAVISKMTARNSAVLEKMVENMGESIEKRDYRKYYKLQREFHDFYISISENEELRNIIESIKNRFMKQAYSKGENEQTLYKTLKQFNNEHREIIALLKKGDAQELANYLKEVHWAPVYARLDLSLA